MSENQPKAENFEEDKERTATRSPPEKNPKVEQSVPKKKKD